MATAVRDQVVRRLKSAGGIGVQYGGPADLVLTLQGAEVPIVLEIKHRLNESDLERFLARAGETREPTVLAVPALSSRRRQDLKRRNVSWIEYHTGFVHLRLPHLAIDLPEDPESKADATKGVPSLAGKAGIVVEALLERARSQALVEQPDIAELSGSTQAWTSKVFSALVEVEALEVVGAGPSKRWRPRPDALLRLWEADGGPAPTATPMYLWSRTSDDLLRSLGRLDDVVETYAIGGVAAVNLHEPTLSSLPLVDVWIPTSEPPARVAQELDAQLIESGANVFLWQASDDPALRLAGPLRRWRAEAPEALGGLSVVTPGRAVVEATKGPGRSPEVGENLRRRILEESPIHDG